MTGTLQDAITREPLAAANIRLLGTSRGTISNTDGQYRLSLESGEYRILFSMLGYKADTVAMHVTADMRHDIQMEPSAILLPEVVVTSEDPAIEIIRRAIANKQRWIERLKSYEMQAFTRQTIYRDTAVAAINESYTRGFWQTGDTLREIITQRRQTANVPSSFNFASVGRILNFSEDQIRFLGYTFVGPTAHDALEYYDYRLIRTRASHGQEIYDIRMIPRVRTVPLFQGTVNIANATYALVGIDVEPGVAFRIPFVKEGKLRYRQQFALYESTYWMPADIRIEGKFTVGVLGFSIPPIGLTQTSVISDYTINAAIPDSIFRKPRLVLDSSATKFDSTYWATNTVLPLDTREAQAYTTLDSTQTLDIQFRPGGAAMTLSAGSGSAERIFSFLDASFNRVEGFHLGVQAPIDTLLSHLSTIVGVAYGFSDRATKYILGATYFPASHRRLGIGAELYRRIDHRPDRGYFSPAFNSLTSLFNKNDYRDYHRVEGGRMFLTTRPRPNLQVDLSFLAERHETAQQATNYSLFSRSRAYRPNPSALAGTLRSIRMDARFGQAPVPLDVILQNSFDVSVEKSSPSITGGDFDFTRYDAVLTLSLPTFGESFLLRPGFRIRASAGTSAGTLPPQRAFDIETASGSFAPLGVMRAMEVKEFSGTSYVACTVEHNFRTIPFLALGMPFLYESNIELILHGGIARTWGHGSGALLPVTDQWYYESGVSLSRIFDLFRADLTWRLTQPTAFRFTLGIASLF